MNFISGPNGSGKTTLILDSVLFCYWGYSYTTLSSLATRDISKTFSVTADFTHNKDNYILKRSYPTHVELKKNGVEVKFSTSVEANKYIEGIVGTREHFQKFQLINAYDKDADILSSGQTTIKKTLFSLTQDIFNNAKTKLQTIKSERERLNKDGMTVFNHYPSEKRLTTLNKGITDITEQYRDLVKEVSDFERDYNIENREKGYADGQRMARIIQKKSLLAQPKTCYTCKQSISQNNQKQQLTELNEYIEKIDIQIKNHIESLKMQKEIISSYKTQKDDINARISSLNALKTRLEARMTQKKLIYDTKDVLVAKTALNELDGLSSYYLKESLKVLIPIVNSVLEKIRFSIEFNIDDKGHFAITILKDKIKYDYKDLSCGEKFLLQISFKIALLLHQNKVGVIICDEGASSLDKENLQHLFSIFDNLPFQIFIILHHVDEIPSFIKTITLEKL